LRPAFAKRRNPRHSILIATALRIDAPGPWLGRPIRAFVYFGQHETIPGQYQSVEVMDFFAVGAEISGGLLNRRLLLEGTAERR
jgi:hypothetical protein